MTKHLYAPEYSNSRALVIGINNYKFASPLSCAVEDATEIAHCLIKEFEFPKENVTLLVEKQATKEKIMSTFMSYTSKDIEENERIIVYFAGHGNTRMGKRGEMGFLVPYDAEAGDLLRLIAWNDFMRGSDLIAAKHMFFIMDACYGGLAITRNYEAGSARFLKNMLVRYSRQVLTAGKPDEVVSDSGGPLPNHSVFTGHLIEALRGKAANEKGTITASSIMSYVYDKVANDKDSRQTPHYGFFDGDGDFLFAFNEIKDLKKEDKKDIDEMIIIPASSESSSYMIGTEKIGIAKRLLADSSASIELHDFIVKEIRRFLSLSSEDNFKVNDVSDSDDELLERLARYESIIEDLAGITACTAYWATPNHKQVLQKLLTRVADRLDTHTGLTIWLNLRWYPILIQVYSAGVAAIAGRRYDSLANMFLADIGTQEDTGRGQVLLIEAVSEAIEGISRYEIFKKIPGHENYYAPLSEYLFKLIQPNLDDILLIGKDYEASFDEFEVMLGLTEADQRKQRGFSARGPVGRFGWKQHNRDNAPLTRVIKAARLKENKWEPLKQGLFDGDYDRFRIVAEEYAQLVTSLNWW